MCIRDRVMPCDSVKEDDADDDDDDDDDDDGRMKIEMKRERVMMRSVEGDRHVGEEGGRSHATTTRRTRGWRVRSAGEHDMVNAGRGCRG
eukprot:2804490-Rhodomonas_salina.1